MKKPRYPYPASHGRAMLMGDGTLVLEGKLGQKSADRCRTRSLCARWVLRASNSGYSSRAAARTRTPRVRECR